MSVEYYVFIFEIHLFEGLKQSLVELPRYTTFFFRYIRTFTTNLYSEHTMARPRPDRPCSIESVQNMIFTFSI